MEAAEFQSHVDALGRLIMETVEGYLAAHKMPWDRPTFEKHTSVDLGELPKDILFFGCGLFPDEGVGLAC